LEKIASMICESELLCACIKFKPALVWFEKFAETQQYMLLSIPLGMTMHSFHPHLVAILSPIFTGSQKRKMRLPTLTTKSALLRYKT